MKTDYYSPVTIYSSILTAQTATKEQIISDLPEIEITGNQSAYYFTWTDLNMWIYLL